MKNSLWLIMIALVACTTEPTDDGGTVKPEPTKTFIEKAAGTHTVAGVDYTVDATTGDITVDTVTYFYVSANEYETEAIYSVTKDTPTEFLGATIVGEDPDVVFSLYLKDRVDFWATADEVLTYSANKVGGSASDSFIADNRTVKIALEHSNPDTTIDYNVNEFTGHLTTVADSATIVYHYMGEAGTGQAYFRNVDKKFLGLAVITADDATKTYKTYLKDRTTPWEISDEVLFSIKHQVGAPKLLLGQFFEQAMNAGVEITMPGEKDTFATLTNGDEIWLMGDNNSVHNSKDRGLTWTYDNETNTDGTAKFSEKELDANGAAVNPVVWVEAATGATTGVALEDKTLFVITPRNVYKSTDTLGKTWTIVHEVTGVTGSDNKVTFDATGFQSFHVTAANATGAVPAGIYFISGNGVIVKNTTVGTLDSGWVQTTVTTPFHPREGFGFGVAIKGSTFYIMAGWGNDPLTESANDVWKSTDGGDTWTEVLALKPDVTDGSRWNLRDRIATVSTDTHVYLMAGGTLGSSDVWRSAFTSDLKVWELVAEDGGYTPKNSAEALYYPAGGGKQETLLLLGGRMGKKEIWRSEAE